MVNINQKGYGILEIVIVVTIGLAIFLSIESFLSMTLKVVIQDKDQAEALYLAKSSLEEARSLRDEAWTNISDLTLGSSYYFNPNGASPQKWISFPGTKAVGKYTVWIKIYSVMRDANDDIVAAGGTVDANTLKIVSSVSWLSGSATRQTDLFEYLVNSR